MSSTTTLQFQPALSLGLVASSSSPGDNTGNIQQSTFVGNTPSTVLFFLALAVGVIIALLFVYFTLRYFVRSRYGLHVYSFLRRGSFFSSRNDRAVPYQPLNRELQEHLNYLRTHHFLRDEFLERRLMGNRRRRRRRGRFAKMKKLTPEEVEKLFPKTSYEEWMRTGSELAAVEPVVREGDPTSPSAVAEIEETITADITAPPGNTSVIELHELKAPKNELLSNTQSLVNLGSETTDKGELHFDSGLCAICLEIYEDDDVVRGLVCGHVFHSDCVDPWLTRRRACCPICKRDYYRETGRGDAEPGSENGAEGEAAGATTEPAAEENPAGSDSPVAEVDNAQQNDEDLINYEFLRNDPNLQTLLQELIPLSERVRVILQEHPELDLESRGRELAEIKRGGILRRIVWRLMGISYTDIYHWAVIRLYHDHMVATSGEDGQGSNGTPAIEAETADAQPETSSDGNIVDNASGADTDGQQPENPRTEAEPEAQTDTAATASLLQLRSGSLTPRLMEDAEEDLSDATRRQMVERMA